MKHILIALTAVISMAANAGTVYRDRYIPVPNTAPCMVSWTQNTTINGNMILHAAIGEYPEIRGYSEVIRRYQAFRVTIVGGAYWEIEGGPEFLKTKRDEFMQRLKDCK